MAIKPAKTDDTELETLMNSCENRFGPWAWQSADGIKERVRLLVQRPTPTRVNAVGIYVAWRGERLTLGQALDRFSDWDRKGYPTRDQVIAALRGATR